MEPEPWEPIPAYLMSTSVNWRDGLLFAVLAGLLAAGGMLWRDRASRGRPRPGTPASGGSTRWTALLVLMPVAMLAVVGWIAVVRDRVSVEDETRREAARWARHLTALLRVSWPTWLGTLESEFGALKDGNRFEWRSADPAYRPRPGTEDRLRVEDLNLMPELKVDDRLSRVSRLSHGWWFPDTFLGSPVQVLANSQGLVQPPGYPKVPKPPAWARELSPRVRAALERLQNPSPLSPQEIEAELRVVRAESKDPSVDHWARFLKLRRAPKNDPNVSDELLDLGLSAVSQRVESITGVPLGALAYQEVVRRDGSPSEEEEELELLRGLAFRQPSVMTGALLRSHPTPVTSIARPFEELSKTLMGLRLAWSLDEQARSLHGMWAIRPVDAAASQKTDWLFWNQVAWWGFADDGTNTQQVTFYSGESLGWAAFMALKNHAWAQEPGQEARLTLPPGWTLSVDWEGRRLPLPRFPRASRLPVLAEEAGVFGGDRWNPKNGRFRVLGGADRPGFVVRIHLNDPDVVFAAQQRRQWLFGGIILAAAVVAGLAAWQMQRSIQRQQALNEEQSNFIASVSHELRVPLASLRLLAEGLASGRVAEGEQRHQYAGLLLQETRRLGRLVENVLDFGRIEQGRQEYQFEPTDLVRLVSATVRSFEPIAAERKVRIAWTEPSGFQSIGGTEAVIELLADGVALQQALSNLLDNALKHAPEGSVVTVRVEPWRAAPGEPSAPLAGPSSVVRISVRDAGPGIPPEDRQRIFERFFRRGSELRRETQGVGLGLAIVRHIVTAHRGRVWVADVPGPGACLVMEFPWEEPSRTSGIAAEDPPSSPRSTTPDAGSGVRSDTNPGSDPVPPPVPAPKAEPGDPVA